MKIVYIAHEYGGKPENIEKVKRIIADIAMSNLNVIPYCPWLAYVESLNDLNKEQRARGIMMTLALLDKRRVSELWIFGDKISEGVALEINKAYNEGIAICNHSATITSFEYAQAFKNQGLPEPKFVKAV
jgi:hypothetical protein